MREAPCEGSEDELLRADDVQGCHAADEQPQTAAAGRNQRIHDPRLLPSNHRVENAGDPGAARASSYRHNEKGPPHRSGPVVSAGIVRPRLAAAADDGSRVGWRQCPSERYRHHNALADNQGGEEIQGGPNDDVFHPETPSVRRESGKKDPAQPSTGEQDPK